MSDFSISLNEDQLQIQKWIHDFAETVVRPAAEEWDEREEFPWPIVEEAAQIGLYGFDFISQAMLGDPTGLTMPVALEELFWGDAGIGLAIFGSSLAAAGIATLDDVLDYLAAGATAVAVGTATFARPATMARILDALSARCASEGVAARDLARRREP